jgi:DNA-binding FrmR family transcriptional regulator
MQASIKILRDKYTPHGYLYPQEVFMEGEDRKKIVNRLKRIEGQIRGLERLVENGAPCLDILTQVSAVTAAVKKAGTEVIRVSLEHCLAEASTKLPEPVGPISVPFPTRKVEDWSKKKEVVNRLTPYNLI